MSAPDKPRLRPGDVLDVLVERPVYKGQGLARHEGQVVFVPRGLPGERVRVRVEAVTPGFIRAEPLEVIEPGPGRREAPCVHFAACGGCAYQHQDYAAQLASKEAVLRDSLRRAGAPWEGEIVVRPSPEDGWRTRATLHFADTAQGLLLGFHQEGSHRVVDIAFCRQLSPAMNAAARAVREAVVARRDLCGRVRHLELAESGDGQRLVASLEGELTAHEAARLSSIADAAPMLTGFGVMAGDARRRRFLLLRGDPHVEATVLGLKLRSHVRSFFQGNRFLAEALAAAVVEATPPGGSVLDLYAGVGLFALPLARRAEEVRGLEINPTAVEDAQANVEANGLGQVRIHAGDVREVTRWPGRPDERIVLDPPRTGVEPDVLRAVAGRRPASLVYVSCDPPTLGRDLKLLASLGYAPRALTAFDLFPDTFHLETVVALAPR